MWLSNLLIRASLLEQKKEIDHPIKAANKRPYVKSVKWRAVFAESVFIGLSILLAFALQDWDEQKDIEERTQIALCNIKSELSFNRTLLNNSYLPRQKGLSLSVQGLIASSQNVTDLSDISIPLDRGILSESLRYSAWSLASESGYLLHANFELATEIGAIIDFQRDQYNPVAANVNSLLFAGQSGSVEEGLYQFEALSSGINEWIALSNLLSQKYETLFSNEDFINLSCRGD